MTQRPIKFRAWRNKEKKMCYKVTVGNTSDRGENYTAHALHDGEQWLNFDELSDIILMQFTGLTDKNGKEIYEGDIVKIEVHYRYKLSEKQPWGEPVKVPVYSNYVVEYRQKDLYAGLYFRRLDDEPRYYEMGSDEKEVIGNIYENPELIKQS